MGVEIVRMMKWERECFGRKWTAPDISAALVFLGEHGLTLLAPIHFNWSALWMAIALHNITGLNASVSFHRNLAHRSFKLPKWLEYFLAYCAVISLQVDGKLLKNVEDLKKQWFYTFLHYTYFFHVVSLEIVLYVVGGLPFLVWGLGVRNVAISHITSMINSICAYVGKTSLEHL